MGRTTHGDGAISGGANHVRRTAVAVTLVGLLAATLWTPGASAASQLSGPGLPSVESGPRPGPDILYAAPSRAPQLENVSPWQAKPILVSGTQAYRDGEWLYQDFLHDDHGATGVPDPNDPFGIGSHLYSPTGGTFTYPTDPVHANNAADLVELRIRPGDGQTLFRVTLNTLLDPDQTAFTIALGDGPAATWPHGAGVSSPADLFLTVVGDQTELQTAGGDVLAPAPTSSIDMVRRQVQVAIPHDAWDPGTDTVRVTIGVGLWDPDAGTYLAPQPGAASASTPGGGTVDGIALVNVGPRFDEPTPLVVGATMAETAVGARVLATWWRERDQSVQLALGDVSPFFAEVDFGRLLAGETDNSMVPTSGPLNRILASHFEFGQGLDPSRVCFSIAGGDNLGPACEGRFIGQLQPYAIYIPDREPPSDGWGLTLLLHSLSANYNQYLSTDNQVQLGERGAGSIVVTPAGRGPDGYYAGVPEADTFEVWADVARHYPVDPTWVSVSGYSMGGFGTYRLLARWPDLFARGFPVVATPGSASNQLLSLRHTPVLTWNAAADELVHVTGAEEAHEGLLAAGIDHRYDLFPTADHLTLAGNDEYGPGADFLGEHRVDGNPATVAYVTDPREDGAGLVADHAYWLSGLRVRDADGSPTGTIEVHSAAFGRDRGDASELAPDAGVLTGGNIPALSYARRGMARSGPQPAPAADRLEVTATNVARVVVDPVRARVTCDAEVVVDSDGPIEVVLDGCASDAPAPPDAPTQLPTTGGGMTIAGLLVLLLAGAVPRPAHRRCG